jgi:hypothetical protein
MNCNHSWTSSKPCPGGLTYGDKYIHKCEEKDTYYMNPYKHPKHKCSCKAKSPNKKG